MYLTFKIATWGRLSWIELSCIEKEDEELNNSIRLSWEKEAMQAGSSRLGKQGH